MSPVEYLENMSAVLYRAEKSEKTVVDAREVFAQIGLLSADNGYLEIVARNRGLSILLQAVTAPT